MAMEAMMPQTKQKFDGPRVKQFSVFLKNKVGALLEVVRLLHVHTVDVVGLSVQDSTDSSIVRLIVSDPETVESLFKENDIAFGVCEMVVVEMEEVAVDLGRLLSSLLAAEVNIYFSYPLLTRPNRRAALAMHVEDHDVRGVRVGGGRFYVAESGGHFAVTQRERIRTRLGWSTPRLRRAPWQPQTVALQSRRPCTGPAL